MHAQRLALCNVWKNSLKVAGNSLTAAHASDCNDDNSKNEKTASVAALRNQLATLNSTEYTVGISNSLWPSWGNDLLLSTQEHINPLKYNARNVTSALSSILGAARVDANSVQPQKALTVSVSCQTDQQTSSASYIANVQAMITKFKRDIENEIGLEMLEENLGSEAMKAWSQAAAEGSAEALYNIALSYCNGKFVPKNMKKAVQLWNESARLGHPLSKYQLGVCSLRGLSVERDVRHGLKLIKESADGGCHQAQFFIASQLLRKGDAEKAEKYLKGALCSAENRVEVTKWLTLENMPKNVRAVIEKVMSSLIE